MVNDEMQLEDSKVEEAPTNSKTEGLDSHPQQLKPVDENENATVAVTLALNFNDHDVGKNFHETQSMIMPIVTSNQARDDDLALAQEGNACPCVEGDDVTKPLVQPEEVIGVDGAPENLDSEETDTYHYEDEAALLAETRARKSYLHDSILSRYRRHSVFNPENNQDLGAPVQVLKEDIYSLIYTARASSQAFWFALFVFSVQITLIWLLIMDLVDEHSSNNVVRLPPGVPFTVNVAQGLGILIIVLTVAVFGDLTTGMGRLADGYDKDVLLNHPNAGCMKWFLSGFLQMFAGASMTMVLFILLMQSTTIIGMCLNFAALLFVQEIDDISFVVGQRGFLTFTIQQECDRVSNLTVPKGRRRVRKRARQVFMVALTVGLYIPYFVLISRQWHGQYVCKNLYVQFGDAYIPHLAYFSGRYLVAKQGGSSPIKIEDRLVYYDATKQLKLAYCGKEGAWVFSASDSTDHCEYLVKSSLTNTFDVVSMKDGTWFTYDYETSSVVPADWFFIACNDCGLDATECSNGAGECIDGVCQCYEGHMGVNCMFPTPTCGKLTLDARTEPLPMEEGVLFPDTYHLHTRKVYNESGVKEEVVEVNYHPAYLSLYKAKGFANATDFMFFTGRRWVIFAYRQPDEMLLPDIGQTYSRTNATIGHNPNIMLLMENLLRRVEGLAELVIDIDNLETDADLATPFFAKFRPYFFSGPVDAGTPSYVLEPFGFDWFRAVRDPSSVGDGWRVDESQPLLTSFLCSECDPQTNPCYNKQTCEILTETCMCDNFYQGSLCEHPVRCDEHPCLNGGTCDSWHGYCECVSPFYGNLCQYKLIPVAEP